MTQYEIKVIQLNGKRVTLECKRTKSEVLKMINSLIVAYL